MLRIRQKILGMASITDPNNYEFIVFSFSVTGSYKAGIVIVFMYSLIYLRLSWKNYIRGILMNFIDKYEFYQGASVANRLDGKESKSIIKLINISHSICKGHSSGSHYQTNNLSNNNLSIVKRA